MLLNRRAEITLDVYEKVAWGGEAVGIGKEAVSAMDLSHDAFMKMVAERLAADPAAQIYAITFGPGDAGGCFLAAVGSNPVDALLADETRRIEASFLDKKGGDERIGTIREEMQHDMDAGAGVFRTREGLEKLTRQLGSLRDRFERIKIEDSSRTFNTELMAALELDFMLEVSETIAHSALAREESRGAHARRDFPERNDGKWLKHTIAFRGDGALPRLEYRDVRITNFEPQARTY